MGPGIEVVYHRINANMYLSLNFIPVCLLLAGHFWVVFILGDLVLGEKSA